MPANKRIIRNRRQQGGPSLQCYAIITPGPVVTVFELPPRGDSVDFMNFIEHQVMPVIQPLCPENFILQQDLASIHNSTYSRRKFAELGIELLPWPSRSPDLNIVENIWSMLSMRVYDGRQFNNKDEIWQAVDASTNDINVNARDQLSKLYESMNRRALDCNKSGGELLNR